MKIEHIAIWSNDIDRLKNFYVKYFNAVPNKKYTNSSKGFSSYFLEFESGSRLEIMNINNLKSNKNQYNHVLGYCHLAITVGSESKTIDLTKRIKADGYYVIQEPRKTGDGYFESVILDPDGNKIEIMK